MKPTRNQLIIATYSNLVHPNALTLELFDRIACDAMPDTNYPLRTFEDRVVQIHQLFQRLTSPEPWIIHARIKSRSESSLSHFDYDSLQVPIEPLTGNESHLALAWLSNEKHSCFIQPYPGEDNLLVQALHAGLPINRFLPTTVIDRKAESVPPATTVRIRGIPTDFQPEPTKVIQVLDRGSVLLGFELAGLQAPSDYDDWRLPDGYNVPTRAIIKSNPKWGTVTVHYTNGELALITSGDGKTAEVVYVKRMENASTSDLKGFLETNKEKKVREEKLDIEKAAKELASKWFVKGMEVRK